MSQPALTTMPDATDFGQQKVTRYIGRKKYEATQVKVLRGPYAQYVNAFHFQFKPKGARKRRSFVEHYEPNTVIVDGWGHPEFDTLLRSLREAPFESVGPGVSIKTVTFTLQPGQEGEKDKYELEFERYLEELDASRVLFDTRGAIVAKR
jgi:hypothetical protein